MYCTSLNLQAYNAEVSAEISMTFTLKYSEIGTFQTTAVLGFGDKAITVRILIGLKHVRY